MQRAANTFDRAVDQMQRVASAFENAVAQMKQAADSMEQSAALMDKLLGDKSWGKAKSINRLCDVLEKLNDSNIKVGGPR